MCARIFVTGLGAITPLGVTIDENWRAVLNKKTAITPITRFDLKGLSCAKGGVIVSELASLRVSELASSRVGELASSRVSELASSRVDESGENRASVFALSAVREAITSSGVCVANLGLITGSNFGEAGNLPKNHAEIAKFIAGELHLGGPVTSISLSCSSGASALAIAADWIKCGHAKAVAVVGVDSISLCSWSGLCSLRTMAKDAIVKPFDISRAGTVFAEGAAAVIIENEDVCNNRGGHPLAELAGWATGNNGFHLTAPPPRAAGSFRVMRDAISTAALTQDQIGFVSAHATATHANDLTESQAISDLLGKSTSNTPVTAIKASSGHLLGAAGTFEAAITVMALNNGIIPPIARTPTPDPELSPLHLVTGNPLETDASSAITNSAGFGGCNASLVFKKTNEAAGELASWRVGELSNNQPARNSKTAQSPDPHTDQNTNSLTRKLANSQTVQNRIAILSSGFLSALGIGNEEAEAAWSEGECACFPSSRIPAPEGITDDTVGEVPEFDPDTILPTAKAYLDRQSLLAMSAAALAMKGAGSTAVIDKDRFGISLGTAWGASETLEHFNNDCIVKGPRLVKPMLFPHTYANAAASLISMEWELRGFHANFAGGRNASSFALCSAVDALRNNECDMILAGGSEALSSSRWTSEASSSTTDIPPGEGAALFVLTRESCESGKSPLAYITGIGISGGNDIDSAIKQALTEASLSEPDITNIYSSDEFPGKDVFVPESMTGRCGGASAAIQLACALLEPLAGPALILTSDTTNTTVAIVIEPGK